MKVPFLIGRLIFGGFFVYSGVNHFLQRQALSQYAAAKKVPAPDLAVTASGAAMILGGASILLGIRPKLGAAAVMAFLGGVTPVMHNFWMDEDPGQRQNDMVHFMKNVAMFGAATTLLGVEEPWPMSVALAQPAVAGVRKLIDKAVA